MRLLRVQVPEFRALKDVDISFEPEFTPQVFPLGSLNGGGKSTLLQLIFVLLSSTPTDLLKNILYKIPLNNKVNHLATITLLINYEEIKVSFVYGHYAVLDDFYKDNFLGYVFRQFNISNEHLLMGHISSDKTFTEEADRLKLTNIIHSIQEYIFKRIYLITPSNHPYLFLSKDEKRSLFTKDNKSQYDQAVKNAEKNLPNFFTFDFVDVLVEVFRRARANDFKERNKNNPFAYTEKLESDINSLFIDGKKISSLIIEQQRHTEDEIQGIFFTLPSGQKIYPEDLSHGELKRLAIFVLIKYHEMQDAIVLIDEIENGFHPDWQRHIVDDLVEWGASNQYILATHSYELCRGVTPAHVKELESNWHIVS